MSLTVNLEGVGNTWLPKIIDIKFLVNTPKFYQFWLLEGFLKRLINYCPCLEKILLRSTVEVHDERSEGVITGQLFPFWISKTLLNLHMTHIL